MKGMTMNLPSILILIILLVIIFFAARQMLRNKKQGKTCSCGCSGCAYSSICHKADPPAGEPKE